MTYSLNKKKRWLLPHIIEERICEYDSNSPPSKVKRGDLISTIDERFKITMYQNENTRYSSTCLLYANNQTQPQILHKNGKRFNSATLTKWINFDTRHRWNSRNRNYDDDRINQPNFGIQQRPGFFPSEVTYEFLYPRRLPRSELQKNGKTSLWYYKGACGYEWHHRQSKDTNKCRRKIRRNECIRFDSDEQECDSEEEDSNQNEFTINSSDFVDDTEESSFILKESSKSLELV